MFDLSFICVPRQHFLDWTRPFSTHTRTANESKPSSKRPRDSTIVQPTQLTHSHTLLLNMFYTVYLNGYLGSSSISKTQQKHTYLHPPGPERGESVKTRRCEYYPHLLPCSLSTYELKPPLRTVYYCFTTYQKSYCSTVSVKVCVCVGVCAYLRM